MRNTQTHAHRLRLYICDVLDTYVCTEREALADGPVSAEQMHRLTAVLHSVSVLHTCPCSACPGPSLHLYLYWCREVHERMERRWSAGASG
jgi:hypothetical protein